MQWLKEHSAWRAWPPYPIHKIMPLVLVIAPIANRPPLPIPKFQKEAVWIYS